MRTQTHFVAGPAASLCPALFVGAAAGASIVLLALLLIAVGHDPLSSLAALWRGSFGSSYSLRSATLVRAIPLMFTGLAVALAFRAGVWNIGGEGQLLAGAAAATAVGLALGGHLGPLTAGIILAAGAL